VLVIRAPLLVIESSFVLNNNIAARMEIIHELFIFRFSLLWSYMRGFGLYPMSTMRVTLFTTFNFIAGDFLVGSRSVFLPHISGFRFSLHSFTDILSVRFWKCQCLVCPYS